jgi:hypothetical protein
MSARVIENPSPLTPLLAPWCGENMPEDIDMWKAGLRETEREREREKERELLDPAV